MRWWQRQGLRFRFSLGISLVLLVVLGVAFLGASQYVQTQLWQLEVRAAETLNAVVATLLEDAMMTGQKFQIQAALEKLGQSAQGRIDAIVVYDDRATLTAFASGFSGGRAISRQSLERDTTDPTCSGCHQLPPEERPTMARISLEGQEVMRNVVPLYNEPRCQTCHGTGQEILGASIVDLRLDRYREASTTVTVGLGIVIALTIVVVVLALYQFMSRTILLPLGELVEMTQTVVEGDFEYQVPVHGEDEMGQLGQALNSMTARLRELIDTLEHRVGDRTGELEQRSKYLEAAAEVSRATASILDTNQLISQVVELIRERFELYYVGLFLMDEANEWAVLRAGTGEAGEAMLARGHRRQVGEGMIGWSVAYGQPRVALEVVEDEVQRATAELPETRSEAAIPLRSRGQVLGALTVQSDRPGTFDSDTVAVLLTMADQIAVALDNTRLLAASQTALDAERRAYGEISREAWAELVRTRADSGFVSDAEGTRPVQGSWQPEMVQAAETGQAVQNGGPLVVLPIKIRDEVIGVVRLRKPDDADEWLPNEIALLEALTEQMSVALDSARAFQETQRRAAREGLVGEITTRMRETLDLDMVLQTAVQEMRQALQLHDVVIQLGESDGSEPSPQEEEEVRS